MCNKLQTQNLNDAEVKGGLLLRGERSRSLKFEVLKFEDVPITSPNSYIPDASLGETKQGRLNPDSCLEGRHKLTLK